MRVGFTGTSEGMSESQRNQLREWLSTHAPITEFHHGDCVGADHEAHQIAIAYDIDIYIHPPENASKRAWCGGAVHIYPTKPYLARNHDIVDLTDVLIVAPKTDTEELRSGTWATYRYAMKQAHALGSQIVLLKR
jgi:hypothetical protein